MDLNRKERVYGIVRRYRESDGERRCGRGGIFSSLCRQMRWLLVAALLLGSLVTPRAGAEENWEEVFVQANQAYRAGEFHEAVEGYQRLIAAGYRGGHLFFNLGNAHFRCDQLGEAILNYERAKASIPRNADLVFNLRYAKEQVVDAIDRKEGLLTATFFWVNALNREELFWGFAAANLLLWVLLAVRLFARSELLFYSVLICGVLWVISGLSLGLKWYQTETDRRAIVVEEEIDVLSGPDRRETVLFRLHEGSVVDMERREGRWALIRVSEDQRGWVAPNTVISVRISPESTAAANRMLR